MRRSRIKKILFVTITIFSVDGLLHMLGFFGPEPSTPVLDLVQSPRHVIPPNSIRSPPPRLPVSATQTTKAYVIKPNTTTSPPPRLPVSATQTTKANVYLGPFQPCSILEGDKFKHEEITLVTGYLDIGVFEKQKKGYLRDYREYLKWGEAFAHIRNPVIAFFNNRSHASIFKKTRSKFPPDMTKIVVVDERKLWSFSFIDKVTELYSINAIYKLLNYPKYTCATHAKFDLLKFALDINPFSTKFYAWLDFGYFRLWPSYIEEATLQVPNNFNTSCLGYTQLWPKVKRHRLNIFNETLPWVTAGFILGHASLIRRHIAEYKNHTEFFLKGGLSNAEEQVLNAMYNAFGMNPDPLVPIQTYSTEISKCDPVDKLIAMYLGYISLKQYVKYAYNNVPHE